MLQAVPPNAAFRIKTAAPAMDDVSAKAAQKERRDRGAGADAGLKLRSWGAKVESGRRPFAHSRPSFGFTHGDGGIVLTGYPLHLAD